MKFKALCLIICILSVFSFCSCGTEVEESESRDPSDKNAVLVKNPLTGEEINEDTASLRPVAVVINNLNSAQRVQAGVSKADIVYETEVEGGITRLLAIYKDIGKAQKLGSIRSARVVFGELSLSHGAVFVHHGIDPAYASPFIKKNNIDDFDTNKSFGAPYAFRENNGMNTEHRVYSSPQLLREGFLKNQIETTVKGSEPDFNFAQKPYIPTDGTATEVTVKFSSSYKSIFTFDTQSGFYIKNSKNIQNTDYFSKEKYLFKNVFLLFTNISFYPDNYHTNIELKNGDGYYFSLGGYQKIKWKKDEKSKIQYFFESGEELRVNTGNSWICINSGYEPEIKP